MPAKNRLEPPPNRLERLNAEKAPIIYRDPCAIFGTLSTPRTKLIPADTINRIIARLRPTRNWLPKAAKVNVYPISMILI